MFFKKNHAVYNMTAHLVLITKYRRKCIDETVLERLTEIFEDLSQKWGCALLEFNGEADHVHLLLRLRPDLQPSMLINNLKTVSSRRIRKEFEYLKRQSSSFWSPSYCLVTCGGAPLEIIRQYIENQGSCKS